VRRVINMKTKNISILTLSIVTAVFLVLTACTNNFTEVRIKTGDIKIIDFDKYDKIIYADIEIVSPPENYSPDKELRFFFLDDFAKITGKTITHYEIKDQDREKIKDEFKNSPNTLLVTGKIIFDIKTRSRVAEVKNAEGKKEKQFVPVQHWTLTLNLEIIETASGEELFKKSYTEKTAEPDLTNPKYNFDDLFFKINNRFQKDITNIKSTQRRYLLLK
jgi:hypothetical protein